MSEDKEEKSAEQAINYRKFIEEDEILVVARDELKRRLNLRLTASSNRMMYGEDTKISNFNDGRIKKKFTTDYDGQKLEIVDQQKERPLAVSILRGSVLKEKRKVSQIKK